MAEGRRAQVRAFQICPRNLQISFVPQSPRIPVTYCLICFALHGILAFSLLEQEGTKRTSHPVVLNRGRGGGIVMCQTWGARTPQGRVSGQRGRREGSVFLGPGPLQAAGLEEEPWARQWESFGLLHSSHSVN